MTHRSVLILTQSKALGTILASQLEIAEIAAASAVSSFRDLVGQMRIRSVDLVIADLELTGLSAAQYLPILRRAVPYRRFRSIGLTGFIDRQTRQVCQIAGIDELIVKPASPRFVGERVLHWLDLMPQTEAQAESAHMAGNVVRFPIIPRPAPRAT